VYGGCHIHNNKHQLFGVVIFLTLSIYPVPSHDLHFQHQMVLLTITVLISFHNPLLLFFFTAIIEMPPFNHQLLIVSLILIMKI
jgi:hypothetical protein